MKYSSIISFTLLFIIILSTSVFADIPSPYYLREGFGSDDGLWLTKQYENNNPYYAKDLTIVCIPEMEVSNDTQFNEYYYKTSGDLCNNGSFNQQSISSVELNGKNVDFSFIDINNKEILYELGRYDLNEEPKSVKVMKVQTNFLFNGISNDLTINNHKFSLKYSEGIRPFWSLALIGIIFGFIGLFIRKIQTKKILLILSILFSSLSFILIRFDRRGLCYGYESPGFIFIGIFLLIFFTIIIKDYLKNTKEYEYKNKMLKIIYGILLGIFIVISLFISVMCGIWG